MKTQMARPTNKQKREEEEEELEFEDDFDEDDEEDTKKSKSNKEEEFEEEEEEKEIRAKPKATFKTQQKSVSKGEPSTRYSAFQIPERVGVKDNNDDSSVGSDVLTLLAKILNDLEDIKIAVGA